MKEQLAKIRSEALAAFGQAQSAAELDSLRVQYLGKKGDTYALYSEGRTIGTFQFESAGMQKYLRELEPSTFEDLIAMNALYRDRKSVV